MCTHVRAIFISFIPRNAHLMPFVTEGEEVEVQSEVVVLHEAGGGVMGGGGEGRLIIGGRGGLGAGGGGGAGATFWTAAVAEASSPPSASWDSNSPEAMASFSAFRTSSTLDSTSEITWE